ncbi:hypothetical protein TNCV_1902611 [Trichonephila clavipes]|nr:hypothetical protein TNCV_1902611 [Trichonephila clavipes]
MYTTVIHNPERKLFSHIDVSEKAAKVSKTTDALDVRRLPGFTENGEKSTDEIKNASHADKDMAKNGSQAYFDDLYKQCQMSVAAKGFYFEGGCVSTI